MNNPTLPNQIGFNGAAPASDDLLRFLTNIAGPNPVLSSLTITGLLTVGNMNGSYTDTNTGNIQVIYSGQTINFNPASNSQSVVVAGYGSISFNGPGNSISPGHIIGQIGIATMNATGSANLIEGMEARLQVNAAGTITNALGMESQLASMVAGANITNLFLYDAAIPSGGLLGTVSVVAGFHVKMTNNGTVATYAGLYLDTLAGNAPTTAYSLYCTDATQSMLHAGNISITGTGKGLTVPGGNLIASSAAFTNNAGAAAGTLTNAPAIGNPTKWIPINDNGTTRNIPAW